MNMCIYFCLLLLIYIYYKENKKHYFPNLPKADFILVFCLTPCKPLRQRKATGPVLKRLRQGRRKFDVKNVKALLTVFCNMQTACSEIYNDLPHFQELFQHSTGILVINPSLTPPFPTKQGRIST